MQMCSRRKLIVLQVYLLPGEEGPARQSLLAELATRAQNDSSIADCSPAHQVPPATPYLRAPMTACTALRIWRMIAKALQQLCFRSYGKDHCCRPIPLTRFSLRKPDHPAIIRGE